MELPGEPTGYNPALSRTSTSQHDGMNVMKVFSKGMFRGNVEHRSISKPSPQESDERS